MHRPPTDRNLPQIGRQEACRDVHQGGFTRAVFAKECMYLTWLETDFETANRREITELLDDAAEFKC